MNQRSLKYELPNLAGKVAVVTGGNAGLGFESSLALAAAGCKIIIGCRSGEKGKLAKDRIVRLIDNADVEVEELNLISHMSIEKFAHAFLKRHQRLDILLNNAGVVNLPELQHTAQDHEMHFATNHLGHFSLTGHLLPAIKNTSGSRIVTVSSGGYKFGELRFDDLNWSKRPYHRVKSYGDSKLANMLFFQMLAQKFERYNIDALSLAAHPGLTASERQQTIGVGGIFSRYAASPIHCGVQPLLMACTCPTIESGDFTGPRFGIRGRPVKTKISALARDEVAAKKLWDYSIKATGCEFKFD